MWKSFECRRRTGESGYMGFAANYENLLSFLLEEPNVQGTGNKDYYQLIRNNAETFNTLHAYIARNVKSLYHSTIATRPNTSTSPNDEENGQREGKTINTCCRIRLVEPRELLNLLNFIEVYSTRLSYAPRPFYRSNIFIMTTLVQMDHTSLVACFFCGKQSAYHRTNGAVCFTTLAATEHRNIHSRFTTSMNSVLNVYNVDDSTIGRVMFNNDLDPERQEISSAPFFPEIQHLHHVFCPVKWLHSDRNAVWNLKDCAYTVRGVSKFHHLMQFLTTYPRPRENAAWLCLINRLSKCESPGATQCTLNNLVRILCHERLVICVGKLREKWNKCSSCRPPSVAFDSTIVSNDFYTEPMHVNSYTQDVVNLSDDAYAFNGLQGVQLGDLVMFLPFGGSHTVLPLVEQEMVSARANTLKPNRRLQPLEQQNSSEFHMTSGPCTLEELRLAFQDGTVSGLNYYRLLYLQGFLVRINETPDNDIVCSSKKDQNLYNQHCKDSEAYTCLFCGAVFRCTGYVQPTAYFQLEQERQLLAYAVLGASHDDTIYQYVYHRYLPPVADFEALFPSDLHKIGRTFKEHHSMDSRLKQALTSLSSTLDSLHADFCVFRIKKRIFPSTYCAICLENYNVKEKCTMVCGHDFCESCYNEVSMTDCCICKRGYRTQQLTTSNSVIEGYLEHSSFS